MLDWRRDPLTWSKDTSGEIYFPHGQRIVSVEAAMSLVVRMKAGRTLTFEDMRDVVRGIRADVPVAEVGSMEGMIVEATRTPRLTTWLVAVLAAVAVTLGGVGIAGVVSHGVTTHLRDIGIRLALGARHRHVLDAVLARTARWLVAGIASGVVVAGFAMRSLSAFLFGVGPSDSVVYVCAIAGCALTVAVAGLIPAIRALRLDPLVVLKQ